MRGPARAAEVVAGARQVEVAWEVVQATPTVACDPLLTSSLAAAVEDAEHRLVRVVSGAGHDAAMIAAVAPIAMLFVRCAGGVSHDPAESVKSTTWPPRSMYSIVSSSSWDSIDDLGWGAIVVDLLIRGDAVRRRRWRTA